MFDWQEWRLRRIARRLTSFELQAPEPDDLEITSADVYEELFRKRPTPLFLGYYTRNGLEEAFKQYGTWGRIEALGLTPRLTVHHPDERRNLLRIADGPGGPAILEAQVRFATVRARHGVGRLQAGDVLEVMAVEWLLLQHPRRAFTPDRPRLPGQQHPGLGLGREILTLLDLMAERQDREGVLGIPEHYHNGLLYSEKYRFFDPRRQGELLALQRDLRGLGLAAASWAVERGLVRDERSGAPFRWMGDEMIRALTPRLNAYFSAKEYEEAVARAEREARFTVDAAGVERVMAEVRGKEAVVGTRG